MGYPYCIVFDRDTLFMSAHFQSWAASKGIKLEPSTAYHPQTDGQSEIVNKEIIQVARACKAEGDEWLTKIPEIQLKLNSRYNASRRNNPFVTVLGFDAKLGLDSFPYPINNYQPASERHNTTSQALTQAKISQAKQANIHRTPEPQHKVGDQVLLSTKNINIQNTAPKMKPLWIGPFTILSANYNRNNYSLDLSTDPSLNLIYNTFHVSKLKAYVNNDSTLFPQRQLEKPGPVTENRYEVEKVLEYRRAPRTGVPQYKVRWLGYSVKDDQWVDAKHVSTGILQDFWTKGSLENTFKRRRTSHGRPGRYQRDETLAMIQNERDRIMSLPAEEEEITTNANNIAKQIFDLFLQY
jgi:hypothetical protein